MRGLAKRHAGSNQQNDVWRRVSQISEIKMRIAPSHPVPARPGKRIIVIVAAHWSGRLDPDPRQRWLPLESSSRPIPPARSSLQGSVEQMSSDFVRYSPEIETFDPKLSELMPRIIDFLGDQGPRVAENGGHRAGGPRRPCEDLRRCPGRS